MGCWRGCTLPKPTYRVLNSSIQLSSWVKRHEFQPLSFHFYVMTRVEERICSFPTGRWRTSKFGDGRAPAFPSRGGYVVSTLAATLKLGSKKYKPLFPKQPKPCWLGPISIWNDLAHCWPKIMYILSHFYTALSRRAKSLLKAAYNHNPL